VHRAVDLENDLGSVRARKAHIIFFNATAGMSDANGEDERIS